MQLFYQPTPPARFADLSKLSPSDPIRTLISVHASALPVGEKIIAAAAGIDGDSALSSEGKRLAKEKLFADEVGGAIQKADQPLRLAALKCAEQSAALEKNAIAKAGVSEARGLHVAEWLRDMDATARNSLILESIRQGDIELIASCLSAPAVWKILTPQLRERAVTALIEKHDSAKAAELSDFKVLIAACRESFQSLARFGRDKLQLQPPVAKGQPMKTGVKAA